MKQIKNLVLGGGIAGLIFSFYNPDYTIITDKVGGQMANNFNLGARYLHDNAASRHFLGKIDEIIVPTEITVGYYDNRFIRPSVKFKSAYYAKSRGVKVAKVTDDSSMNGSEEKFNALMVHFPSVIAKLAKRMANRIIIASIQSIDLRKQIVHLNNGESIKYEKLVSTIPMPLFARLANRVVKLKAQTVTYVSINNKPFDMKEYDFVYVLKPYSFHRITAQPDKTYTIELLGEYTEQQVKNKFGFYNVLGYHVGKYIQIVDSCSVESKRFAAAMLNYNIKLLGRYAQWDRHVKTEDIIEKALYFRSKKPFKKTRKVKR